MQWNHFQSIPLGEDLFCRNILQVREIVDISHLKCKQDISNLAFSSRRLPLPHPCLSRNRETIVGSLSQPICLTYNREYFLKESMYLWQFFPKVSFQNIHTLLMEFCRFYAAVAAPFAHILSLQKKLCINLGFLRIFGPIRSIVYSLSILNTAMRIAEVKLRKYLMDSRLFEWFCTRFYVRSLVLSKVFKEDASHWPNTPYLTWCF